MSKRKIYHVIEVSQKMIKTFPKQGHQHVVFNAVFYRNGKKLNSIDQAAVQNFSALVRSYDKSENPDKIKVEFKDQDSGTLIWSKTFQWTEVDDELPRSLHGFAGLGEAEVNDLVQRRFSEFEKSRELDRMQAEVAKLRAENEELEFQVQDMQSTLDAKKQIEYYTNIIGMALPGLAKFLTGTPMASAINFLAGTAPEATVEAPPKPVETAHVQRESILEKINTFCQSLNNQELGTMYLMLSEIEKDRQHLQRILQFITKAEPSQPSPPTDSAL